MCGIVGIIGGIATQVTDGAMGMALQQLSKRGPDHSDSCKGDQYMLGHARLAIIDTSQAANQPFWDESKRYVLVFNGEIFNFKELRSDLQSTGMSFRTQSDTEVLLHLLIKEGKKAIQKLNGFFAFCFLDTRTGDALLVRDRFGIKPLVYTLENDAIVFASEIKALQPLITKRKIDPQSLQYFFQFNYIPAPYTIFEDVRKLNPGELLEFSGGKIVKEKYYSYYPPAVPFQGNYEQAKKEVKQLLEDATQMRMIADVPLGAFLSGGIDSSIVSTIASRHTDKLNTFSIGFKDEPFFDETQYANLIAKKIKSEHTVFSLSNGDLLEHYTEALDYLDEPFADSSALNMFILSKLTKGKVTAVLSGDGADELFSGYNKHAALFKADHRSLTNGLVKHFGEGISGLLPKSRGSKMGNIGRKLEKFSAGMKLTPQERYILWASFLSPKITSKLVGLDFRIREGMEYIKEEVKDFNDYLFRDFNLVLEGDMLRKVDAMSMANSLEVRTPFLDYRLVELVFSMPASFKIDSKSRKKILKDAFRDDLPSELFNRSKHGFEVPLMKWYERELKSTLEEEVFNREKIEAQGVLNWRVVEEIQKKLTSKNPGDAVYNTWALLSFQRWAKKNEL